MKWTRVFHVMDNEKKHRFLTVVAALFLLSVPGCCCQPVVCMPQMCCPNPYWMEDLQYDCCDSIYSMNSSLCRFKHSLNCQMCQLKTQLTACRCTTQTRSCPQPQVQVESRKVTARCATTAPPPIACAAPASKCDQRCRRCKQQPCRCGSCDCDNQIALNPQSTAGVAQSFSEPSCAAPGGSPELESGAIFRPATPAIAPPVPATRSAPTGPSKTMGPTPIPNPKANPTPNLNPGQEPAAAPAAQTSSVIPPPDPSIPLEDRENLNQVGFRKSVPNRPLYNGWKPVTELPKVLR